jgi:hypothetical protein
MVGGHRWSLHWDSSDRVPAPAPYYTRESPMQQWLYLLPAASGLLNLAAALTNLTIAIINRHNSSREQPTNETKS